MTPFHRIPLKTKWIIDRTLLLSILICSVISASAQGELDETKMVGFACFFEGRETKVVSQFGKMLKRRRYPSIKRMLHSINSAERFMAVLCLERLSSVGRVTLSEEEKVLINQIKTSREPVDMCSGCIPTPGVPFNQAFDSGILWGASEWLSRHIGD